MKRGRTARVERAASVKRTTFWLFIVGGIILAYALYELERHEFERPKSDLNVEPRAAEEIEKAQRR